MPLPLLAAYLLFASLAVQILSMLLYFLCKRSLEVRFAAIVTFLLVVTTLAFAPLLFLTHDKNAKTQFQQKVRTYAEVQAGTLNSAPWLIRTERH